MALEKRLVFFYFCPSSQSEIIPSVPAAAFLSKAKCELQPHEKWRLNPLPEEFCCWFAIGKGPNLFSSERNASVIPE